MYFSKITTTFSPNGFTNNYGYGPFGVGPSNGGFDSFGFYKDKFYNSGLPPKYTFSSYRNYYPEYIYHPNRGSFPGFFEEFSLFKGRHGDVLPDNFELKQQHRYGGFLVVISAIKFNES